MTDKMGIQEFGDLLIRTRDLDPLYVGLVGARRAGMDKGQLARWLLAYWCFYHAGAASWISEREGSQYWRLMSIAAHNGEAPYIFGLPAERWPRAAERRHFRGQKCVDAVEWLRVHSIGIPEAPVMALLGDDMTDKEVMTRVQKWPMFGPWIAFKVADMMERVWGLRVRFDRNIALMYDEPRAALDLLREVNPTWQDPTPENLYNKLLIYFMAHKAPPVVQWNADWAPEQRQCGPQEVETVLCKWKSYMGGHYHIGKDIHEQREGLRGWGNTADQVLRFYPEEVDGKVYALRPADLAPIRGGPQSSGASRAGGANN